MNIFQRILRKIIPETIPETQLQLCWNCSLPIILDSHSGRIGLCSLCYNMYKEGILRVIDHCPQQIIVQCQECGHILTCRDRRTVLFETNKIALCCKNPYYSWHIEIAK